MTTGNDPPEPFSCRTNERTRTLELNRNTQRHLFNYRRGLSNLSSIAITR